jgi:hypothetical protein
MLTGKTFKRATMQVLQILNKKGLSFQTVPNHLNTKSHSWRTMRRNFVKLLSKTGVIP